MKKMLKRLCTGFLALATVVTALPTTPVHAESKQYWTEYEYRYEGMNDYITAPVNIPDLIRRVLFFVE